MHTLPINYSLQQRYRIQKTLSQGGFGITYEAENFMLGRKVCIKELYISGNSTRNANMSVNSQERADFSFEDFKTRFIEEGRQLACFDHPNIVRINDIFLENNTAYLVMDFINGITLKEYVEKNGALPPTQAFKLVHQLLDAVEAVHQKGMLHRDIKPENILLTKDNKIVLIDFGSAREFIEGKTQTHTTILTPGYAPIEQYSNKGKRGTFTDIYALGATLYFLLTGQKPLAATERVSDTLTEPHQLNPAISTQISSAIMLAMQMKAEDRFQSVGDFRDGLKWLEGKESATPIRSTHKEEENFWGLI